LSKKLKRLKENYNLTKSILKDFCEYVLEENFQDLEIHDGLCKDLKIICNIEESKTNF